MRAIIVVALTSSASAQVYDLKADWSDASNPNGTWSYREGGTLLPKVAGWQNGCLGGWSVPQSGWADHACNNTRIPFWFRSNGSETFTVDFIAGDIVIHSTDPFNGVGNGHGNVVWTAPGHGHVDISGSAWLGRDIGRSNDWRLHVHGALISQGSLFDGDPYNRANPFDFAFGSGGVSVLDQVYVCPGSTVVLEIVRTSPAGEFTGVNLSITFTPGPKCYADCEDDCDLDVFDFLCFQGQFSAQAPYADCEGDGDWDVFDFLCFQSEFAGGC